MRDMTAMQLQWSISLLLLFAVCCMRNCPEADPHPPLCLCQIDFCHHPPYAGQTATTTRTFSLSRLACSIAGTFSKARYTATGAMALSPGSNGAAAAAAEEAIERPLGPPAVKKLTSWDLFRSMGSPKFIVAVSHTSDVLRLPLVDYSS